MVTRNSTVAFIGIVFLALGAAGCSKTPTSPTQPILVDSTTTPVPTPTPTPTPTPEVAALESLSLSDTSVQGQAQPIGTVTLTAAAPEGGAVVTLESSSGLAKVPSSVTVAAGTTTATFVIETSSVPTRTTATLKAIYSGVAFETTLTVTLPLPRASFTVTKSGRGSDVCMLVDSGVKVECDLDGSASDGLLVKWIWTVEVIDKVTVERAAATTGEITVGECEFSEGAPSLKYSEGRYVDMTVTLVVEDRDGTRSSVASKMVKLETKQHCGFGD